MDSYENMFVFVLMVTMVTVFMLLTTSTCIYRNKIYKLMELTYYLNSCAAIWWVFPLSFFRKFNKFQFMSIDITSKVKFGDTLFQYFILAFSCNRDHPFQSVTPMQSCQPLKFGIRLTD